MYQDQRLHSSGKLEIRYRDQRLKIFYEVYWYVIKTNTQKIISICNKLMKLTELGLGRIFSYSLVVRNYPVVR